MLDVAFLATGGIVGKLRLGKAGLLAGKGWWLSRTVGRLRFTTPMERVYAGGSARRGFKNLTVASSGRSVGEAVVHNEGTRRLAGQSFDLGAFLMDMVPILSSKRALDRRSEVCR